MQKNLTEQFTTAMRNCHLKITPARQEVFNILSNSKQPLLPKEIVAQAKTADTSSVYRVLPLLAKHKIARKVSKGFKTLYELGDNFSNHQHYVICEHCGKSVAIKNKYLEQLANKITHTTGMKPTGHFIELLGICKKCEQKINHQKDQPCKHLIP
jgi:Fur family ferric uptake transcriptional regulator